MQKRHKLLFSLIAFGSITLSGCYFKLGPIELGKKQEEQQNNEENNQNNNQGGNSGGETTPPSPYTGDYYASIDANLSGNDLLSALRTVVNSGTLSFSYDWSRFEAADEDPENSSNVIMIYARTSVKKSAHVSGSKGWNREHTFPDSKMSNANADDDNHIIYASDCKVKSARSNIKMGVVTTGSTIEDSYGNATTCKKTSNLFDPNNVARGIVARSTMYAAAMYGYDVLDNFESYETLINWHLEYTVSSFDIGRNEKVFARQKNRNPFVDHPEYACKIWGNKNKATRTACQNANYSVD